MDDGLQLGVFDPSPARDAVVLVAQAAYHLDDYVPTVAHLARVGVPALIACVPPRPSALKRWRSSWWRHGELMARVRAEGLPEPRPWPLGEVLATASAIVVRNDWGPTRRMVVAANEAGLPTFGWVEGVQDFADVDTGRGRRPYRTVGQVLCLGEHDRAQLPGAAASIVGSQRLWSCWRGPTSSADGPTVANVNFTYGVLEDARTPWVRDVTAAARANGTPLVLSRHPADRGIRGRRWEERRESAHDLLTRAPRLVSRFSTLCYEALTLGVDLVYHNPHGEAVPTFAEPAGAFTITRSRAELRVALATTPAPPEVVRTNATAFLQSHLALDDEPAARAAAVLATASS